VGKGMGIQWAAACVGVSFESAAGFGYRWVIGISIIRLHCSARVWRNLRVCPFGNWPYMRHNVQFHLHCKFSLARASYAYVHMVDVESLRVYS